MDRMHNSQRQSWSPSSPVLCQGLNSSESLRQLQTLHRQRIAPNVVIHPALPGCRVCSFPVPHGPTCCPPRLRTMTPEPGVRGSLKSATPLDFGRIHTPRNNCCTNTYTKYGVLHDDDGLRELSSSPHDSSTIYRRLARQLKDHCESLMTAQYRSRYC